MNPVPKILFYVDFGKSAAKFLPWVAKWAQAFRADLCVIAIAPDMTAYSNFYPPHARFQEKVMQRTETRLQQFLAEHLPDWPRLETRVLTGRVTDKLMEMALREQVDLVICGNWGSFLDRLLMGRVAATLAKKAPFPVLILPEV